MPLSIEQLIVDESRLQFSGGVDLLTRYPLPLIEDRHLAWSTALRYGWSSRLELNVRAGLAREQSRTPGGRTRGQSESYGVGLTWQARREDRWPALILESRGDFIAGLDDRGGLRRQTLLAATAYKSIDPVVLSLRISRLAAPAYQSGGRALAPGTRWRVEPLVNFAVNPQVTLLGGLTLRHAGRSTVDDVAVVGERVGVSLRAGAAYAADRRNTLFILGELAGGSTAGQVSLLYQHTF